MSVALLLSSVLALLGVAGGLSAQPPATDSKQGETSSGPRGSLIEDRTAQKLLEAGDARLEADEAKKAVEIWQSVIERYPRSRVRFMAHMRLGKHFLERERAYDRARVHFTVPAAQENSDEEQRAEATLQLGICFYHARNFGKCFQVMRDVVEKFPVSPQVNEAYYYIGLGHFQQGHYSRAITALEKVGTAFSGEQGKIEKVEAGKRLFIKIEDADLAALESGKFVPVVCRASSGDVETVKCFSVGRNVRVVLGSISTQLGTPIPGNGKLELRGDDTVQIEYVDQHTADKKFNRPVLRKVTVVGDALVAVVDGAFSETLRGVVLGKPVNIQITDADRDVSAKAEQIKAVVEIFRRKTDAELESQAVKAATDGQPAPAPVKATEDPGRKDSEADRLKLVDRLEITLVEVPLPKKTAGDLLPDEEKSASAGTSTNSKEPQKSGEGVTKAASESTATKTAPLPEKTAGGKPEAKSTAADKPSEGGANRPVVESADPKANLTVAGPIHTGVFRTTVQAVKSETAILDDALLQALPGDILRISYVDERHRGEGSRTVVFEARCVEGNLGGVRVTRAVISDQELRVLTRLKTAAALTSIGNRYKEFGLKKNADDKYAQALLVCDEIMREANVLGGRLLEETYVQLWKIYYEMDNLNLAAAMAQRLQAEFPNSGFVDEALLQLANVARKQKNYQRAIGIYSRLVAMQKSQLRGEAQFGIAQCYEDLALLAGEQGGATQLMDRSFQEYKKVYDNFPDSGRVGEAVAKMAKYYYDQKDYARAIDVFETVLSEHPDAKFLDVILFNYGRCLYRMNKRPAARQKFDQLISDFPESPLAADSKKISEALAKGGF